MRYADTRWADIEKVDASDCVHIPQHAAECGTEDCPYALPPAAGDTTEYAPNLDGTASGVFSVDGASQPGANT